MRNILKFLFIVQEVSNKGRKPMLGKGFTKAYRLNPYNPLSYLFIIVVVPFGMLLFGIIGFWTERDIHNPFKWN